MKHVNDPPKSVEIPLDLLIGWTRAAGAIPAEYAAELYVSMKARVIEATQPKAALNQ